MEILAIRHRTFEVIHALVLVDEHGIVAPHGGLQQPIGLLGVGRGNRAQTRDAHEYLLHACGVL
jgi:hypothetical protein